MPLFKFHLRHRTRVEPDETGIEFADLNQAYLQACAAIPDTARDLLIEGEDPMVCAYVICDAQGRRLMEVPFTETLSPSEWRLRQVRRRPHGGARSERARDELALTSFRRIFGSAQAGCVLMTPELKVVEMTEFGALHSHVDPEAIRGLSILDIFADLKGQPKKHFTDFMMLARAGEVSEVVDLPYYVLDEQGRTANGWWTARTWPIFDDDDRVLGLVEWAMPFTKPVGAEGTLVRVAQRSSS